MSFESLSAIFESLLDSVDNDHLAALLVKVFRDPAIRERFEVWPAAKGMHHAYRHGLMQHTLEVADLAMTACSSALSWQLINPPDRSLAITGALLHDIGKIFEYEPKGLGRYTISMRGQTGHVGIGYMLVAEKIAALGDFPPVLAESVLHIIASHHGRPEYGALVAPATAEAFIVHQADLTSARLAMMQNAVSMAQPGELWGGKVDGAFVYAGPKGTETLDMVTFADRDDEGVLDFGEMDETAPSAAGQSFAGAFLGDRSRKVKPVAGLLEGG